jgi:hypothetical protein
VRDKIEKDAILGVNVLPIVLEHEYYSPSCFGNA